MPESIRYEIRIKGVLDEKWKDAFSPFTITTEEDETLLRGVVNDQAGLFGVLLLIRDLGIRLVSVNSIPPG